MATNGRAKSGDYRITCRIIRCEQVMHTTV